MNTTKTNSTVTRSHALSRKRNIGIAAHIDAGKTTLTERILFYAGAIHHAGEVHDGNTTMDFDPIEQRKGITIAAASISCTWTPKVDPGLTKPYEGTGHRISIIDTPGHVDFTAEVERSMRVLDGAIAVFSAVEGVQPQTERIWRQATRYGVPRLAFINKMDRSGADFERVVEEIRIKLGGNAWPVLIPIGSEGGLRGQIDVINEKAILYDEEQEFGLTYTVDEVPHQERERAVQARTALIAALAEIDEQIADAFLREEPIGALELKAAIRRQTVANRFVPVVGGSAFKYIGVQPLLDAVIDYLPNPTDLPLVSGIDPDTGENRPIIIDDHEPLRALVFKLSTDEFSRRHVFVRVYSGVLRPGDTLLNAVTGRRERISRVSEIRADRETALDAAFAGDIVVVSGLKEVATGHTLCSENEPLLLEPPTFPVPVVSMAIEPETRIDQERMGFVLQRLAEDDPTFKVHTDPQTSQTLIAGMGELHLEVIRERMLTNFKVATRAGAPRIAYKETITVGALGEGRHIKQSGGSGQYGHVILEVAPDARGNGLTLTDKVIGGAIPKQFIGAVKKGILDAATTGPLGGYPTTDLIVTIRDGSFHSKDSNDLAFQIAGSLAFKDAFHKALPLLLEPVMAVECSTPSDYQGDLVGDLLRRRGLIREIRSKAGAAIIDAEVPLAEMFGYANAIRSLSKGRADYSMMPLRFEVVPPELAARVLDQR
ncbi:MAG: elongation factor G [Verrucomicrobiota bacterium]